MFSVISGSTWLGSTRRQRCRPRAGSQATPFQLRVTMTDSLRAHTCSLLRQITPQGFHKGRTVVHAVRRDYLPPQPIHTYRKGERSLPRQSRRQRRSHMGTHYLGSCEAITPPPPIILTLDTNRLDGRITLRELLKSGLRACKVMLSSFHNLDH